MEEVFTRLEKLRPDLLRYCRALTGSLWDAEDVASDVMEKVMQVTRREPHKMINKAYIFQTAKNTWIDRCRQQKRQPQPFLDDSLPLCAEVYDDSTFETRELLECLAHRLQPKPFVILLLCDVFDFTARETATVIESTEAAVQVALSRARARLRKIFLQGDALEPSPRHANTTNKLDSKLFESVVNAFRRHDPQAIYDAYMQLYGSGGQITTIQQLAGKLFFSFQDPDGNVLMVSS